MMQKTSILFIGLGFATAVGFSTCSRVKEPVPLSPTRGVLLISLDTLRADRLGCYGHVRDTSPFIDSLAGRGILFENSYVHLPGTLPSHMSIFTGLRPGEHGVYPPDGVLSDEVKTLPEVFQSKGFRTGGFTEGGYMHGSYGFARGFDTFSDESAKLEDDIERTLARGLDFLRSLDEEEPFFLFLHSYAIHDPYPDVRVPNLPMDDYRTLWWPGEPPIDSVPPTGPLLTELNRQGTMPGPETLEYYQAIYDAQIRYVDDVLRGFFGELEAMGLLGEMTIVLTSDHGEEFGEHGKLLHRQIYRETLHVPLLVLHPGVEPGRRIPELVRSIDLASTLYDIAGFEAPARTSGVSLAPLLAGFPALGPREAIIESHELDRALVRQSDDGIHQLLWSQSETPEGGLWMTGELLLDTFSDEVELETQSFYRTRELEILVDGEPLQGLALERSALELPVGVANLWLDRGVAFDAVENEVQLTLQSFQQPRRVEIAVGGQPLAEALARPAIAGESLTDEGAGWEPVGLGPEGQILIGTQAVVLKFSVDETSDRRVTVTADGCDQPAVGKNSSLECFAFQVLNSRGTSRLRHLPGDFRVPTAPRTLRLAFPEDGKKRRISLRVDSCDVPVDLGLNDDARCLSARLSAQELWKIELFHTENDPLQRKDLSASNSPLSRSMLRSLSSYRAEPMAPSTTNDMDPALVERLKALGYLP